MIEPRLFVDVDDTLILYDSEGEVHPYGIWRHDPYRVNTKLIGFINLFRVKWPEAMVVIWSGGGANYARMAADAVLSGVKVTTLLKDRDTFGLVRENDIVVDDQDLKVDCPVLRPDDPMIVAGKGPVV